MKKEFAAVTWCAEDIINIKPEWSKDKATAFLDRCEDALIDALVRDGWEHLDILADNFEDGL